MCVVGGVIEVSFELPLSLPHVHKCVPTAIVRLSYSRTEGLKNLGLNNVCPLLFLACLSSSALHRNLLASFVLISLIQRLVSLFPLFSALFLYATSPAEPSIPPLTFLWHAQQCENAAHLLTGCNSLKTHN